jgi:hypothetical protein
VCTRRRNYAAIFVDMPTTVSEVISDLKDGKMNTKLNFRGGLRKALPHECWRKEFLCDACN